MPVNFKVLKLFLPLLILACVSGLYAQKFADKNYYLIDSLTLEKLSTADYKLIDTSIALFHKEKNDTNKINIISNIIEDCWDDNVWPKYNDWINNTIQIKLKQKNLTKEEKVFYEKNLASSINNMGYLYSTHGDYKTAITFYEKSLKIQKKLKNIKEVAVLYNNIGRAYVQRGETSKALTYYYKSLKISELTGDKQNIAVTSNNIGLIYSEQKSYDLAIEQFWKSLKNNRQIGNKNGIALAYNNIGYVYSLRKDYKTTLKYYKQCLALRKEVGGERFIAYSLNNIGFIYGKEKDYKNALLYFKKSLQILEKIKDKNGLVFAYHNLGDIYAHFGKNKISKKYADLCIELSKEIGNVDGIKNAAQLLYTIYNKNGNYKDALLNYHLYIEMRDSLSNETLRKKAIQENLQYEYDKKSLADSLSYIEKQKLEQYKYNQNIKQQKTYTYIGIYSVFALLIIAGIILKGYSDKKKNNLLLEEKSNLIAEKNKEITDSINYAKRIQQAILPSDVDLNKYLQNSFVFYQPKDIVAGDFYWLQKIDDIILYAVADCTGHGVPGAMVSVVCHHALNRAVREYKLISPADILNKTREIIIETFEKGGEHFNIRDGMDIAFCSLNFNKNEIIFAGANNPLYIFRDNELIEIKGDKQPIGKYFINEPFNQHHHKLKKGDVIYTFSDGYADQFGGPKEKKLMYKNFKEILLSIHKEQSDKQKVALEEKFNEWKGDLEQLDDVCIIGVRI